MSSARDARGAAPVGLVTDLNGIEAASVIYLRLWCDGPDARARVWNDLATSLGTERGRCAVASFEDLCGLCTKHGRRPLMRHSVQCKCVGADEACFANFIAAAAAGGREDAMLIATLLVRADVAPSLTALATDFGLALMRMNLSAPKNIGGSARSIHSRTITLH